MAVSMSKVAVVPLLLLTLGALLSGCGSDQNDDDHDHDHDHDDDKDTVKIGIMSDTHFSKEGCRSSIVLCDKTVGYMDTVLKKMKAEGATWAAHVGDNKDENANPAVFADHAKARAAALENLRMVETKFREHFPKKIVHIAGNHDMDRLTKAEFLETVGESSAHYVRDLGNKVSAVVIDATYDGAGKNFSTMTCIEGGEPGCTEGAGVWYEAHIPAWQITWLTETLTAEKAAGRRVLLFSHFRLDADRDDPKNDEWMNKRIVMNAGKVRDVLRKFQSTVLAVFHGHDHRTVDSPRTVDNIGYYTLPALVVATKAEDAPFITVKVFPEQCRVQVAGFGQIQVDACNDEAWCKDRKIVTPSMDWRAGSLGGGGSCAWEKEKEKAQYV